MTEFQSYKPMVIILDVDRDRCLREEAALEKVIEEKGIYASGMSNYGLGYISRAGVSLKKLPCIEIESLYFYPPRPDEELTEKMLGDFLDMMVANKHLRLAADVQAELDSKNSVGAHK